MDKVAIIVALLVAAMLCFFLEILTPTFGVLAFMGVAALAGAVWVAFLIAPFWGILLIVLLIFLVPAYLVLVVKLLPRSPLGKRMFLGKAADGKGAGTPEAVDHEGLVGRKAVAETTLRPSGAIRVNGKRMIARAESGMIPKGATVRIVRSTGMNVVVREVKEGA